MVGTDGSLMNTSSDFYEGLQFLVTKSLAVIGHAPITNSGRVAPHHFLVI